MHTLSFVAALLLLATISPSSAEAQERTPREVSYEVERGGVRTMLNLRMQGTEVSGTMQEGQTALTLRGTLTGARLQGQLFLQGNAASVAQLTGELQADQLDGLLRGAQGGEPSRVLMRRVGATQPATPRGGTLDQRVIGVWQQQTMTNSSGGAGGFASFTTLRTLTLNPDGTAQQTFKSVGGGAGWSHRSDAEVEFTGRWLTRDGEFWVLIDGAAAYTHVGGYQLEAGRMVVIVGGQRQIWRR